MEGKWKRNVTKYIYKQLFILVKLKGKTKQRGGVS